MEKSKSLDLESLSGWLDAKKIKIRYNDITHKLDITGFDERYNPTTLEEQMHIIIHDEIKREYTATKSQVQDLLSVISQVNRYNPIFELLSASEPWDRKDRIAELFEIMHIGEADDLSRILIRKWLWQTMSMAHNGYDGKTYGADGILVLQGPQGIGKTSICNRLGITPDLVKTGLYLDVRDKDTWIRATTCWIGELGELESTLRTDNERLKSFITDGTDIYRIPFGRKDLSYPRRTSLIATCNSEEFLLDDSGSRRFWVVPLDSKFDLDALKRLDIEQLWNQVFCEMILSEKAFADCFRLSCEEVGRLQERNSRFFRKVKAQSEIEDIIRLAKAYPEQFEYTWLTATQFKEAHASLRQYDAATIGRALRVIGIEETAKRLGESRVVSKGCRYLPLPKN